MALFEPAKPAPNICPVLEVRAEAVDPSGKSLHRSILLSSPLRKIFRFSEYPNQHYIYRRPVPQRGVAQRHETRSGMRWTRAARLTGEADADGEGVWASGSG